MQCKWAKTYATIKLPGNLLTNGQVIGIVTRIILTYAAEIFGSLAWMGAVAQAWTLPMLIYMNAVDFSQTKRWVAWTVLTLILSLPSRMSDSFTQYYFYQIGTNSYVFLAHALQAGWNSRNSNSVRSRALSAAMYNMCVQLSGIIASNVYQDCECDESEAIHQGYGVRIPWLIRQPFQGMLLAMCRATECFSLWPVPTSLCTPRPRPTIYCVTETEIGSGRG